MSRLIGWRQHCRLSCSTSLDAALLCVVTLLVAVQLSQRFWNSHAMINMSVWLRTEQPTLASALSRKLGMNGAADLCLTQVRVVIGSPRQELGGLPFPPSPRPLPWPLALQHGFFSCVFSSSAILSCTCSFFCHYSVSSFWFIPFVILSHTCTIPFLMSWIDVPTCNALQAFAMNCLILREGLITA